MQAEQKNSKAHIINDDARTFVGLSTGCIDLVITSSSYVNNYDYADATRLEMTFWGEINFGAICMMLCVNIFYNAPRMNPLRMPLKFNATYRRASLSTGAVYDKCIYTSG